MSNLVFDESSSNREASHGYAWWFSGDTFEKAMAEERKPRKRSLMHRLTTHPGRLTILYFMMLGALSTLLLLTPTATPKGEQTTFTTAFFTAISAISTCGISIVNSTTHWSAFGQAVLIFSVQMGGLGVMTFASLIALAVNHHLKATQKLLTANELGHHETRRDQGRAHRGHRHRVHHRRHHVRGAVPRPVQSQSWQCAAHAVGIVVLRGHGIQQRRLHP